VAKSVVVVTVTLLEEAMTVKIVKIVRIVRIVIEWIKTVIQSTLETSRMMRFVVKKNHWLKQELKNHWLKGELKNRVIMAIVVEQSTVPKTYYKEPHRDSKLLPVAVQICFRVSRPFQIQLVKPRRFV